MTKQRKYYKVFVYPPGLRFGAATTRTFTDRGEAKKFLIDSACDGEILEVPS